MTRKPLTDPDDKLLLSLAGEWAKEKHTLLAHYIDASSGARDKWGPSTYMDLYSGPGRQLVEDSREIIDGSPLVAWAASNKRRASFAHVLIADGEEYVRACETRLKARRCPVQVAAHDATEAAQFAVKHVDPTGLHLAFADPYRLRDLPWRVFEPLFEVKRIDLIVHFSQADLTRNLDRHFAQEPSPLDDFAPGWRSHVERTSAVQMRGRFFEYWVGLFKKEGFKLADKVPLVVNTKSAPLYRLALFSRHDLAGKLWNSVADTSQTKLF